MSLWTRKRKAAPAPEPPQPKPLFADKYGRFEIWPSDPGSVRVVLTPRPTDDIGWVKELAWRAAENFIGFNEHLEPTPEPFTRSEQALVVATKRDRKGGMTRLERMFTWLENFGR